MTKTITSEATKTALMVLSCALVLGFQSNETLAAGFNLTKGEAAGNDLIDKLTGGIAIIVITIAFIVTGFLAAFNKIPWFWFFAVVLGGFFIFGSGDLAKSVQGLFK